MRKRAVGLLGVALVLGLSGVAAFLRIYRLEDLPPGFHGDEAIAGMLAQQVLEEGWIGPFATSWGLGAPAGTIYFIALVFKVVGASPLAVRLATALLGTAAVPLMYLLGRQMFGPRAGVVSAALLAFSYWHIHLSRIASPMVSLPLMEIAALYFLFRGLRSKSLWAFPVGGVFVGLSIYSYHTAPLFLLTVVLVLAYLLLRERRRWSYYLPRFCLLFGVALLVALPFAHLLFTEGLPTRYLAQSVFRDPGYQQLDTVGERAYLLLGKAARAVARLFFGVGIDGVDGLGQRGVLDTLTAVLFVGGVGLSLARLRDERYLTLVLGTALGLLGSILSTELEGQYRRIIGSLPFIVLAAAAFADYLVYVGKRLLPWLKGAGVELLLVVCLAAVASWNVNYYFRVFAPSPTVRWVFAEDLVLATRYLRGLGPETYVYFYSVRWSWNYETRRFLLPNMVGEDRSREFGQFSLEREPSHGSVVYLLLAPYGNLIPALQDRYPGGQRFELREGNRLIYAAYVLE